MQLIQPPPPHLLADDKATETGLLVVQLGISDKTIKRKTRFCRGINFEFLVLIFQKKIYKVEYCRVASMLITTS